MSLLAGTIALWAAAVLVGGPVLVLFVEVLASMFGRRPPVLPPRTGRFAVLVPAHDEEQGIERTVRGLLPQLTPADRLLVVADNCTDQTAARAAAAGATVVERNDSSRRGKGAALRFGLDRLAADPPDVVVIIDADTDVEAGALEALHRSATAFGRPIQAMYMLRPPEGAGMRSQVSALAFGVKNLARPRGLARLGLPCPLVGTGMAIPWALLDRSVISEDNIVEDLQMGIDLALAGHPPILCGEARVSGWLPLGDSAARIQRRRWEHGHLRTLLTQAPRLAGSALRKGKPALMAMAFDLAIPPLSFLCLFWAAAFAATAFAAHRGWAPWPFFVTAGAGVLLACSVLLAWARHLRREVKFLSLLFVPFYIAWKVPLYIGFFLFREKAWVRTPREAGSNRTTEGGSP